MFEINKKTYESTIKKIFFIFLGIFILSLFIFIPVVRDFIIYCLEKFSSSHLQRKEWNFRLVNRELSFLIILSILMLPFVRITDKRIILYLSAILAAYLLFLCYIQYFGFKNLIDCDDGTEMMLWRECAQQKTFFPIEWNYTTEIRILNTQLIGAPLFLFLSDWALIRTIVTVFSLGLLFVTNMFLLKTLGINSFWTRYIFSIIVILPFSNEVWTFMTRQCYYIPHVIIEFLYIALFIRILDIENKNSKRNKILFLILSFICGMSGIRYSFMIVGPLVILSTFPYIKLYFKQNGKLHIKDITNKKDYFLIYAILSAVFNFLGLVCYAKVLSKIFTVYGIFGKLFMPLGTYKIDTIINAISHILGYRDGVWAFSLKGMLNILFFPCAFIFMYTLYDALKTTKNQKHKTMFLFSIISFIVQSFIIINIGYATRYFILPLFLFIPCLAILVTNKELKKSVRQVLAVSWIPFLLLTSAITMHDVLPSTNSTNSREEVISFLLEHDYKFGYASFLDANVLTGMTNGKINIASIKEKNWGHKPVKFPEKYEPHFWGQPKYYFDPNYHNTEKIFFLVAEDDYLNNQNLVLFRQGKEVYRDNSFRVYEFANHSTFINTYQ